MKAPWRAAPAVTGADSPLRGGGEAAGPDEKLVQGQLFSAPNPLSSARGPYQSDGCSEGVVGVAAPRRAHRDPASKFRSGHRRARADQPACCQADSEPHRSVLLSASGPRRG